MSHDAPAALPLIAWIAGWMLGRSLRDAICLTLLAVLLIAIRHPRGALVCAVAAAGVLAARHDLARRAAEARAVEALSARGFAAIDAPIDREWTRRGDASLLRLPRFAAGAMPFEQPLAVYARFEPKAIEMEQRIALEGFLRANDRGEMTVTVKSPRLLRYAGSLSWLDPAAWNRALDHRLRPLAQDYPTEVALVEALALGRGEKLADDIRDNYKRGGTYHLLVFSGLQIAFAAGVIAFLLRALHAPRLSDWSLLLFSILAPLFIGPTASVSRASIGIGLYALSRILGRPTTIENLWCLAALLRLMTAPHDLSDAAFQLTYAGAGALIFIGKPLAAHRGRWMAYAVAAECAVTPLTLFHFHQYALGGSVTTMLLTPVIFAMLVVSAMALALPVGPVMRLITLLHWLCTSVNALAAPLWGCYAAPPAPVLAVALIGALVCVAVLRGRSRAIVIITIVLGPVIAAIVVAHGDVEGPAVTLLDVGQGDSIVLRTPGHALLVDAGTPWANTVPMLLDRGVRGLDAVVLTHVHPDHCGGLPDVIARLRVGQIWISPRRFRGDCAWRVLDAASSALVPIHLLRDGERKAIGAMQVEVLLPRRTFRRASENNASVVLRVTCGERRMLLTGDVEREAESDLRDRDIAADLLKVAHHGSHSSSTAAFLDAVSPRAAFISCGRRNLFGHPHDDVLQALRRRAIFTHRTDLEGSIDILIRQRHVFVRHEIDTPR